MSDENLVYYQLGLRLHPGALTEALEIFPVNVRAARQLSAEMAFIYEHGHVPEWSIYIERFEKQPDGGYIFVHYDTRTA